MAGEYYSWVIHTLAEFLPQQVWSGSHSKNTPGSSVASAREISPPRSDATQRGSLTDWTSLSRPTTSRSWDEVHDHVRLVGDLTALQSSLFDLAH